jgi:hypothetical protein
MEQIIGVAIGLTLVFLVFASSCRPRKKGFRDC